MTEFLKTTIKYKTFELSTKDADAFDVLKYLSQNDAQSFLLEGFEEWEGGSPYSYIGIDPFEILKIQNDELEIVTERGSKKISGPPMKVLEQHLKSFEVIGTTPDVPFCGGAVGFLGYECARYFDKALDFLKPASEAPDAVFLIFKKIIAVSKEKDRILVIENIFNDAASEGESLIDQIQQIEFGKRREITPVNPDKLKYKTSQKKSRFVNQVKQIKRHIREGDIFQCVLSQSFNLKTSQSPLDIYGCLRKTSPSPFMFYLNFLSGAIFGASPERLVKVSQNLMETNPIAGTRPRGRTAAHDKKNAKNIFQSVKEKAEHLMLVDLGRNDIGRVAKAGSVKVTEFMKLHKFSDVMHLISKVQGELDSGKTVWDGLASCFPAGTLSGAPKIRAMEIINALEGDSRHFYGGAVVRYDFSGGLDSCIVIRSAYQCGENLRFRAGAGIVADSNPAREYQEVLDKTRAMRRAILMAEAQAENKR